jgi:hypothetical protein
MLATLVNASTNAVQVLYLIAVILFIIAVIIAFRDKILYTFSLIRFEPVIHRLYGSGLCAEVADGAATWQEGPL